MLEQEKGELQQGGAIAPTSGFDAFSGRKATSAAQATWPSLQWGTVQQTRLFVLACTVFFRGTFRSVGMLWNSRRADSVPTCQQQRRLALT